MPTRAYKVYHRHVVLSGQYLLQNLDDTLLDLAYKCLLSPRSLECTVEVYVASTCFTVNFQNHTSKRIILFYVRPTF